MALSTRKFVKFEALKCHFLHSEHGIYSINLSAQYLYYGQKSRKALICDPTYGCLNIFDPRTQGLFGKSLRRRLEYFLVYLKINCFNIISSNHNSNMEYQRGGGGCTLQHPTGRPASAPKILIFCHILTFQFCLS
jgi:hypothetical protein